MTWKRGVDILSFGGTKNGCWCAEAIVLFDLGRAKELAFLRKRAAQLFSKSRFIAAQLNIGANANGVPALVTGPARLVRCGCPAAAPRARCFSL